MCLSRTPLILVIYVDDVIAFCLDKQPIQDFIKSMQEAEPNKFILEDMSPPKDYLGIEIVEKGKRIHMTQTHLIDTIIGTANLDTEQLNDTPTPASGILHKCHPGIAPGEAPFNYRSLIGQLNYLAATTMPDITFATHQCTKFCNAPQKAHFIAAKRIVHYQKGTRTKGLILDFKDKPQSVQCFADADFAGAWDNTDPDEASIVKSRTGFLIKLANCPIFWSSKQQELTALSTFEAEYIALSSATRHILFILQLLEDLKALSQTDARGGRALYHCGASTYKI